MLTPLASYLGAPPKWTPPQRPPILSEDDPNRIYYRDINAARWPKFPFEPAIRALYHTKPDFNGLDVDIVGCGSTLGNLLRFVSSLERSFHFNAEKVGKTLFLVRQENSPTERIEGIRGYGHSFPEAYTTWDKDVRGSDSHQRVIEFEFGGLKILVRSEADGYLQEKLGPVPGAAHSAGTAVKQPTNIAAALGGVSIGNKNPKALASAVKLKIETSANLPVAQPAIFDIKTRSIKNELSLSEILPRLWLNRTPNFILAQHVRGSFAKENIQVMDVSQKIDQWETEHARELQALRAVLKRLVELINALPEGKKRVGVWRVGAGPLQVRALTKGNEEWSALPKTLKGKWVGEKVEEEEAREEGAVDADDGQGDSEEDDDFLNF